MSWGGLVARFERASAGKERGWVAEHLLQFKHGYLDGDLGRWTADELSEIPALDGYANIAQMRWNTWRRKSRLSPEPPESFADVLADVSSFALPPLSGSVGGRSWSAERRRRE